jgi:LysM repeat protein
MSFWSAAIRFSLLAAVLWWGGGCGPILESSSDETKNPHFQVGMNRKISRDYQGAIEAFKKALEANPHSGAAHYELGLIYYQNVHDYAAAIYHFQEYLALRPNAPQRDLLSQFIMVCKQELAREVSLAIVNQQVQRQLDELARENLGLRQKVEMLSQQLALATNRPLVLQEVSSNLPPARVPTRLRKEDRLTTSVSSREGSAEPGRARTHTIRAGDTLAALARRYGVRLSGLIAANPGLDPKRMRVGQVINIPVR